jgi:nitroimidazol reductase NimA-like FMN-containing flavoprotein (pyridoxamine 5'-phosphate oxidase superfamily)
MENNPSRNLQRHADRELHLTEELYAILDEAKVVHIGFVFENEPVVIPMGYARDGDSILFHSSTGARFALTLKKAPTICATVTILDDLIVARSAFNCSMNYRSVVAFGTPEVLEGDEKWDALAKISEGLIPGLWERARPMTNKEAAQTMVMRLKLDQATAKSRTGGANDDEADLQWGEWAGRLPVAKGFQTPITNSDSLVKEIPDWINKIVKG